MHAITFGAVATALALATPGTALAADPPFPTAGRVHNTVENGWLSYDCDPPKNGLLTCTFVQTSFRQKTKASEAAERLSEETKDMAASLASEYNVPQASIYDSPRWKELCSAAKQIQNLLGGSATSKTRSADGVAIGKMTSLQKRDAQAWAKAIDQSCTNQNLDGMKQAIALALDQDQRTCIVGTNPFTQSFRAQYSGDDFQSWVVADSTPAGDCGVINVSRLVPGGESWQWRYFARKVVTNPTAELMLLKCGDLDEKEYLYDWPEQGIPLQCDYIKPGL